MDEQAEEVVPNDELTWNDFTVPQLKEELSLRGLEQSGKKQDLIARLEKYDMDMAAQQKQDDENGEEFVVWNVDDDADADVEFVGSSNGKKDQEEDEEEEEDADEKKDDSLSKPAEEKPNKEPDPEFTVTPAKDKDMLYLTWAGEKVPIPFKDEITKDLTQLSKQQNIIMYPVQIADLFSDALRPLIESAVNVSTEMDETIPGQPIKGYLRLKFGTVSEAERAVAVMKEYSREEQEFTVKNFGSDDSEGHVLSKVKKEDADQKGPILTRLVYVGNLPSELTDETLKQCFTDALRVILPSKEDSTEKLGYAYLEYTSETEAAEAAKNFRDVELEGRKLYVIRCMTERMMTFGLLKDSLRKYWLEQIRSLEAVKTKSSSQGKTLRELQEIETKLARMKQRIKKDNQKRELLTLPVPESEIVEVPDSEEEKGDSDKAKDEKPKEDRRPSDRHISNVRDRRRSPPPRRRFSPPPFRGGFRGGSRGGGGYRGGPSGFGGRDAPDRLVDQLQELVGALAHRERADYPGGFGGRGGRGNYYDAPPRGGRGGYGGGFRGDYRGSGSRFGGKRPGDDYPGDRKRHAEGDDYPHYGGGRGGGGGYGSYGGPRRGGPYY